MSSTSYEMPARSAPNSTNNSPETSLQKEQREKREKKVAEFGRKSTEAWLKSHGETIDKINRGYPVSQR